MITDYKYNNSFNIYGVIFVACFNDSVCASESAMIIKAGKFNSLVDLFNQGAFLGMEELKISNEVYPEYVKLVRIYSEMKRMIYDFKNEGQLKVDDCAFNILQTIDFLCDTYSTDINFNANLISWTGLYWSFSE